MIFNCKKDKIPEKTPPETRDSPTEITVDANDAEGSPLQPTETHHEYPKGLKLALVLSSAFLSVFLISLDRLIVATALPRITDEFHSENDIGWYGSAYLLTNCAFQLPFGKVYAFFSIKYTFLTAIFLFEVGSAVCGAAPSSTSFIVGRAVAGFGSAGVMTGMMMIVFHSVPLHRRPTYQAFFGAVFGISSVLGPILGGVFTSHVTWRWCFYINLPIGGAAIPIIFFLLQIPDRPETKISLKEKMAQLDYLGTFFLLPGCVCLLLALQWGGSEYPWSSWRIILLLTLSSVLLLAFCVVQVIFPKTATIPPHVFKQRTIFCAFCAMLCMGSSMMIFTYYLPIWFQAIKGYQPEASGIRTLPLMLAMVAASLLAGVATRKLGYYMPPMLLGICLMAIGSGVLYTFRVDTPQPRWIGYQFLLGFGIGMCMQAPNLAAQTVLSSKDVSVGASLMFFGQTLGGAIFLSAAQNVLSNGLIKNLASIPGVNVMDITKSGATSLTDVPKGVKTLVLEGYNKAIMQVFLIGIIVSSLAIIGAMGMEWKDLRAAVRKPKAIKAGEAGEDIPKSERDEVSSQGSQYQTKGDDDGVVKEK